MPYPYKINSLGVTCHSDGVGTGLCLAMIYKHFTPNGVLLDAELGPA
jgi:hypothetical protein